MNERGTLGSAYRSALNSRGGRAARGATVFVFACLAAWWIFGLVTAKPWLVNRPGYSQAVYSKDGKLLRLTLSSDEKYRLWVPLRSITQDVVRATIEQEDRHFYRHIGVNPWSMIRGFTTTYITRSRRVGGSTISMQLARMRFNIRSQSVWGKLQQIYYALLLERHYSKAEILEAYLNSAPYGGNVEGIGAASLVYFGKDADRLTTTEASTLVVIPQNPSARAPEAGRPELVAARDRLLPQLLEEGADLPSSLVTRRRSELPFLAPHFSDDVVASYPFQDRIRSTIDLPLQRLLEAQVRQYVDAHRQVGVSNATALLVDYRSMDVVAAVGSADYRDVGIRGQVNGTKAKRSPGSALKPFIYALAIDQGIIHPETVLKDTKLTISAYNPENYDREYLGPIPASEALVRSRNVPAIYLANKVASPSFYDFLRGANVRGMRSEDYYGLALALGGVEVSMEEMASLYAGLANGGFVRPLRKNLDEPIQQGRQLLTPEASYLTMQMLQDNPRPLAGFDSTASERPQRVAWKTGTSFGFRDAWSAGIVGPYVLVVWVGNFDGQGNPYFIGRESAGVLFFSIVDGLQTSPGFDSRVLPSTTIAAKQVDVCSVSGELPGPHCKHKKLAWFIPGKSPIKTCSVHREVMIDEASGLRVCEDQRAGVRTEVFEFWSSDVLRLFKRAGLPRRLPPPWQDGCIAAGHGGVPPQITSPQSKIGYTLRVGEKRLIPLSAITDTDTRSVYWFVDNVLVGTSESGQSYFWPARPGRFSVRALDDSGRSASGTLSVEIIP